MKVAEKEKERQILMSYGESYATACAAWLESDEPNSQEYAINTGKCALNYFARAKAFDELSEVAESLVINTDNTQQLQIIIAELHAIVEQAPVGKIRWGVRTCLAHALNKSEQLEQALLLYTQSAREAEKAQDWQDICWIYQGWANALFDAGHLTHAREIYQRTVQIQRQQNFPEIGIVLTEQEIFRIDVVQGKAKQILPVIEQRLTQCRMWYQAWPNELVMDGEVDDAFDVDIVIETLMSALDVAVEAHTTLENWQSCLDLLSEMEKVEYTRGAEKQTIAKIQFNRSIVLIDLGHLGEAQKILDKCLPIYRDMEDVMTQSRILSTLADIWDMQDDVPQAIALERQALFLSEQFDNPEEIADSHSSLSNYLHRAGFIQEDANHRLASLVYYMVTNNQQSLEKGLHNIAVDTHEAKQSKLSYLLPRLHNLLKQAEFDDLRQFLQTRNINLDELQNHIDELVKKSCDEFIA